MLRTALIAIFALTLVACDGGSSTGPFAPTQPEEVSEGKSDELDRDIEKVSTSESLRSGALRDRVCDAADSATERKLMDGDCRDQEFEVTAYYGNTAVSDDGEPLLVAMDVEFKSDLGYEMTTKLIRQVDVVTHGFVWTARHIATANAPEVPMDTLELEAIIDEHGSQPADYGEYHERFEETALANMPTSAFDDTNSLMALYEAENPEEYIDTTGTWRIMAEDLETTLGWCVQIEATIENGELGWVYYYDADGVLVEEFDWST